MLSSTSSKTFVCLALSASLSACGGGSFIGYHPFGTPGATPQAAAVELAAVEAASTETATPATAAATYANVMAAYTSLLSGQSVTLQDELQAATDVHGSGNAGLGAYLDQQYLAAIQMGAGATTGNPLAAVQLDWAREGLEKLPLTYIYFGMHRAASLRTREGLDTAYALYSFVRAASGEHVGLHPAAEEYAPNPATYSAEVEILLVEAHRYVEANTTGMTDAAPPSSSYTDLVARLDRKLLQVFATGVRKYLRLLQANPADDPHGHLIEGRLFWVALQPYVGATNITRMNTIANALYPNGQSPGTSDFNAAYGLDAYVGASYDGSPAAAITELDALLMELGAY